MPKPLQLDLTDKQRAELIDLRNHHHKPYIRERAAALLKIADGQSANQVAKGGLLKKRWHVTVGRWVERFKSKGAEGLKIKSGRGRKPSYRSKHQKPEEAKEEVQHLVNRAPEQLNQVGSRWKLETVRKACDWMGDLSLSGVWRVLDHLGIALKRGRDHVHSPDPNYVEKLADIVAALDQAVNSNGRIVFVFNDEYTFYRQPSLGRDYGPVGSEHQPLALRSLRSNNSGRIVSGLNAVTGQTTSLIASKINLNQMVKFYQALRTDYPDAETIYVAEDNWPVHHHPDVLAALEPQRTRWELPVPPNWPKEPSKKAKRLNLPIQLLPLPTYASWCNPIEKLWRWLKQELMHLHRHADDWQKLKEKIKEFLDRFREGSEELLRYVGLTPNSKLYGAVIAAVSSCRI